MRASRRLLAPLLPLLAAGCLFRPEVKEADIEVPRMKTPEQAELIRAKLERAFNRTSTTNLLEFTARPEQGRVVVRYNADGIATLNLLHAIAEAGYDARLDGHEVKAVPAPPAPAKP